MRNVNWIFLRSALSVIILASSGIVSFGQLQTNGEETKVRVDSADLDLVIKTAQGYRVALKVVDSLKFEHLKDSIEMERVQENYAEKTLYINNLKSETVELKAKSADKDGIIKAEKGKRNKARLIAVASVVLNVALIIILL